MRIYSRTLHSKIFGLSSTYRPGSTLEKETDHFLYMGLKKEGDHKLRFFSQVIVSFLLIMLDYTWWGCKAF